jgi:hypothetical protein
MNAIYSPELDEIKIFYSPAKAIQRMQGTYDMVGIDIGTTSATFQPVREAWTAAVFLLGYSQITKTEYWLRENPKKHLAPDVFAITLREPESPRQRGVSREVMEIEVCEYDVHAKTTLPELLKAKLRNKIYNSSTFLLCYIHLEGKTRLIDVIDGIKDIKTTVREIWLLFHLADASKGNFVISRIYLRGADLSTTNLQYKGNYIELFKLPQREMIKISRGLTKKVEFNKLGYDYIPLPRLKKKS